MGRRKCREIAGLQFFSALSPTSPAQGMPRRPSGPSAGGGSPTSARGSRTGLASTRSAGWEMIREMAQQSRELRLRRCSALAEVLWPDECTGDILAREKRGTIQNQIILRRSVRHVSSASTGSVMLPSKLPPTCRELILPVSPGMRNPPKRKHVYAPQGAGEREHVFALSGAQTCLRSPGRKHVCAPLYTALDLLIA